MMPEIIVKWGKNTTLLGFYTACSKKNRIWTTNLEIL